MVIIKPNIAINLPCLNIIASLRVFKINEATSLGAIFVRKFNIGEIKVFFPNQAKSEVKNNTAEILLYNFFDKRFYIFSHFISLCTRFNSLSNAIAMGFLIVQPAAKV